jgi:hypothetical protein
MVIIDSNKPIQPVTKAGNDTSPSKVQSEGFDAVFKQEMAGKTTAPIKTEPSSQVGDVRPAWFEKATQEPGRTALDRVENLIDTMAAYQNKLIENGATLHDIHGLVQQMTTQSEALARLSEKMDASDDLKVIVNQSLMLSSMEIARYYDGHYVD